MKKRKEREVAGLIRLLHERVVGESSVVSFVGLNGDIDDYADSLIERLRCMTDAEYRECVYGPDVATGR